ncbi:UPF0339 protein [Hypericibacter adhaerens]|jgi:uncharacterized protein YegP (UPF0339 family)|uniref:UPF0339 protein n=1 Tax=Hypericibacter adhaerens TaxID=2602016 RepID=A0A5J6N815_9PROT|nr:UPF0339 protein [Hypericibacter adhaerens]
MYYQLYRDSQGYWRWRLKAGNGQIVSDSGEGYVNKADCLAGISLNKGSSNAPIYES